MDKFKHKKNNSEILSDIINPKHSGIGNAMSGLYSDEKKVASKHLEADLTLRDRLSWTPNEHKQLYKTSTSDKATPCSWD